MPVLWATAATSRPRGSATRSTSSRPSSTTTRKVHANLSPSSIVPDGLRLPIRLADPAWPRVSARPRLRRRHPARPSAPRRASPRRPHRPLARARSRPEDNAGLGLREWWLRRHGGSALPERPARPAAPRSENCASTATRWWRPTPGHRRRQRGAPGRPDRSTDERPTRATPAAGVQRRGAPPATSAPACPPAVHSTCAIPRRHPRVRRRRASALARVVWASSETTLGLPFGGDFQQFLELADRLCPAAHRRAGQSYGATTAYALSRWSAGRLEQIAG